MIHRTKEELRACENKLAEKAREAQEIMQKAENESRSRTDDENAEISALYKQLQVLRENKRELEDQLETEQEFQKDVGKLDPSPTESNLDKVGVKTMGAEEIQSLGDQFINAKGYKGLIERGLSGEFSTGQIEMKATLATTPGSALTPDQRVPGIVETLYQRLYVADLLGQASTNSSQVTYVEETTATNAAAAVAEGQAKPESTLAFGEVTEPVRKIATVLPVTDEMLEEAPQISAYINQRLVLFIKIQEEAQLLRGAGTGANLQGLIGAGRNSVGTYANGTVDDAALALFKAMNGTRGSSQLDVDGIVIHPDDWQTIRTAKDTSGQYYGGGPFYGPYGGPQGPAGASQFSVDNLWGVRVVVTSAIGGAGTALVGAFSQAASLYRRSGISVEATNSHSTWFADNISALRAEERLALAVFRQSAFTVVTGL